jgi:class 3 adenylate cyclase
MPNCRLAAAFLNASINKRGARAELRNGMDESHASLPPERSIEFRFGIHLGDVVEETDGDLMGDGVNIAARLEGISKPGAIIGNRACPDLRHSPG